MKKLMLALIIIFCLCTSFDSYANNVATSVVRAAEKVYSVEQAYPLELSQTELLKMLYYSENTPVYEPLHLRLNREIYNVTESICNEAHLLTCFETDTVLFNSYKKYLNPLIYLALTINETGLWMDTTLTWSSAIYSAPLNKVADLNNMKISAINYETYLVNDLKSYLLCGSNCSVDSHKSHSDYGKNDNDSLGPLQIRRSYIEEKGYIEYNCGATTTDLMCWRDNVQYIFHKQGSNFARKSHWNKDYELQNTVQLAALMGVAHNTGPSFQVGKSAGSPAGSTWYNAQSVYDYAEALSTEKSLSVLYKYIDNWFNTVKVRVEEGKKFTFPGQWESEVLKDILKDMGVNIKDYARSITHKQYYPLKAILNYLALEKLYDYFY